MKKEIFDAISSWHQEQKKLLNGSQKVVSRVLKLAEYHHNISDENDAAQALSEILGDKIETSMIFWGVPYSQCTPCPELKISSGFVYPVPNLGWILIWKDDNKIFFLDKNLFKMEKCFDYNTRRSAYALLTENIKIRGIIILILVLIIIMIAYFQ